MAEDAGLTRASGGSILGPFVTDSHVLLPELDDEGRLAASGAWRLILHSRKNRENLIVTVPYRGLITATRSDAPSGRHWPSEVDQVFRESWIDSGKALSLASANAREVAEWDSPPVLFELSSRANLNALASALGQPLRDGMFKVETSWRISFERRDAESRSTAIITVPAYGDGEPTIEVHSYDKHGRPIKFGPITSGS